MEKKDDDLKSRRFLSDAEFDKKEKVEIKKKSVDLSERKEFKEQLEFLRLFENELKKFLQEHSLNIKDIEKEIWDNVQECENLAQRCNIVRFAEDDGELILYFWSDDRKFSFPVSYIDEEERYDNTPVCEMFEKRISDYKDEVKKLKEERAEVQKKLDELKPRTPKKVLKFFTDSADKAKCEQEFKVEQRHLKNEIKKLTDEIKDTEFQIEANNDTYLYIKKTDEFLASLTPDQKSLIKSVYGEINKVVSETNQWYGELNAILNKKPNLKTHFKNFNVKNPKSAMLPLLKYVYEIYDKLMDEFEISEFSDVTDYLDFGENNSAVDLLTQAMDNGEFGKINKKSLKSETIERG